MRWMILVSVSVMSLSYYVEQSLSADMDFLYREI